MPRPWTTWQDVLATLRRRYADGTTLRAHARGGLVLPLAVAVRAPTAREASLDFGAAADWADAWRAAAVAPARVEHESVGGRLIGASLLPRRVRVDTAEDLWRLLGVSTEVARLDAALQAAEDVLPAALGWAVEQPHKVLALGEDWPRLLLAARWIRQRGDGSVYLRQVDAPGVDTKLVERHRAVLAALLDRCLPAARMHPEHPVSDLARRYGLRPRPEYVRLRSFHPDDGPYEEITVRLGELAQRPLAARTVVVLENEITYLAFPAVPGAAVVLGGGYAVDRLAGLPWLADRRVAYWGDLDTHGFAIVNRLRAHVPHARSFLMDAATLLAHREHWGREPSQTTGHLANLTEAEAEVHRALVDGRHGENLRLEQERVRFSAVATAAAALGADDEGLAEVRRPG